MGGRGACGNALCLFSQPFMGLGAQCMEMVQDCELRSGPRQLAHCPVQSGVTRARVLSLNKALGGGGRDKGQIPSKIHLPSFVKSCNFQNVAIVQSENYRSIMQRQTLYLYKEPWPLWLLPSLFFIALLLVKIETLQLSTEMQTY